MNTAVKIKSCSRASAGSTNGYILERQKNQEKDILVLEKNEMPPLETLSLEEKKEIKSLQTKISTYTKRLDKAIEENKPKSIATNQKNIEEAQKKLEKFEKRPDQREKKFTEFTIALTNSDQESYKKEWSKESLEYVKKRFPDLQIISAVEHRDQHSPHMHILLYSKDEPITQVLARSTGQKDTSRESMKEAYSTIAHDFHSFANKNIATKELDTLQKGRNYVSLGQFKEKGNYEAQNSLQHLRAQSRNLDYQIPDYLGFSHQLKNNFEPSVQGTTSGLIFKREVLEFEIRDIQRAEKIILAEAKKIDDSKTAMTQKPTTSTQSEVSKLFKQLKNDDKTKKITLRDPAGSKQEGMQIDKKTYQAFKEKIAQLSDRAVQEIKKIYQGFSEKRNEIAGKIQNHPDLKKEQQLNRERTLSERAKTPEKTKNQGIER